MKQFLLIAAFVGLITPAFAQKNQLGNAKTTATNNRLVSMVTYNTNIYGYFLSDSVALKYSGHRGSHYNYNRAVYLIPYFLYSSGPTANYLNVVPNPNNNDSFLYSHADFDDLEMYRPNSTTKVMELIATETRSYNGDGTIDMASTKTLFTPRSIDGYRQVMVYNNGHFSKVYGMQLKGSIYDTTNIRSLFYDAQGNCLVDSMAHKSGSVTQPYSRYTYTYDVPGLVKTSFLELYDAGSNTFEQSELQTNIYNSDGQLQTARLVRTPVPGYGLTLAQTDTFQYSPGVPGYIKWIRQVYASFNQGTRTVSTVNNLAKGYLRDTVTVVTTDYLNRVTDMYGSKFRYNAADEPLSVNTYDLTSGSAVPFSAQYYQYESYNDGLGVAGVPASNGSVQVYPNPATNVLHLSYATTQEGVPVFIRISNITGQTVYTESVSLKGGKHSLLLSDNMAQGQYLVTVLDEKGQVLCNQNFVKQ